MTGKQLLEEQSQNIVRSHKVEEFEKLHQVMNIVEDDKDSKIIGSWENWFMKKDLAWVTVKKYRSCRIWKCKMA